MYINSNFVQNDAVLEIQDLRLFFQKTRLLFLSYNIIKDDANKPTIVDQRQTSPCESSTQDLYIIQKSIQIYHILIHKDYLFFKLLSSQEYQFVFRLMYLAASVFSAVLLRKVYLFQTMPEFDGVRAGSGWDFLYYSIPFGVLFTAFDLLIHYFLDDLCVKYYLTDKKYQGKARQKRAYTLVKWAYSIAFYLVSSLAAFLLIKDTSFFPTWLGGNGSCLNIVSFAPSLPQATQAMKIFYLFQFGKHFSRLFSHMFIRQEGNYYEYILHHSLSTFLILFSYLTNQWLIGVMVLLCHDMSDFFLIIARGYKDYKNYSKKLLQVVYVFAIVGWIGGRLIVFPICCVYPSLVGPSLVNQNLPQVQSDVLFLPYKWMGFMLVGLQILQVFWTYYIGKAFVEVNVSQKIAQNNYQ